MNQKISFTFNHGFRYVLNFVSRKIFIFCRLVVVIVFKLNTRIPLARLIRILALQLVNEVT